MSAPTFADTAGERRRRRRLRRTATEPAAAQAGAGNDALAGLQAEVVLLREENARLKSAGDREPDLGALLDRARSLPRVGNAPEDRTDEAAQLLVEGMVMRESLLAVCREVSQAMGLIEARLTALGGAMDDAAAVLDDAAASRIGASSSSDGGATSRNGVGRG